MLTDPLVRLGAALLAVYVGWTLLSAYALPLFLQCAAVAGWRLWHTAATLSGPLSSPLADAARGFRPGADRRRARGNRIRHPPLPRPSHPSRAPRARSTVRWPSSTA